MNDPSRRSRTRRNRLRARPTFEAFEVRITPVQDLSGSVVAVVSNLGPIWGPVIEATNRNDTSLVGVTSIDETFGTSAEHTTSIRAPDDLHVESAVSVEVRSTETSSKKVKSGTFDLKAHREMTATSPEAVALTLWSTVGRYKSLFAGGDVPIVWRMYQPDLRGKQTLHLKYTVSSGPDNSPVGGWKSVTIAGTPIYDQSGELTFDGTEFSVEVFSDAGVGVSETNAEYDFAVHVEWTLTPEKTPDLVATGLVFNENRGGWSSNPERGVVLTYRVDGGVLDTAPRVAFYWADASMNKIGGPLPLDGAATLPVLDGEGLVKESARWGSAPAQARFILAVLDPDNMLDEPKDNNTCTRAIHSREQILDGAIQPELADGNTIQASFVPGRNLPEGPLTLSEAEVVLGVDHFNWYQTVHGPGNWEIQTWRGARPPVDLISPSPRPVAGELLSSAREVVDPIVHDGGGETDLYFVRVDGFYGTDDVQYFAIMLYSSDAYPFYLDEDPRFGGPPEWGSYVEGGPGGTVSKSEFQFRDAPKVPYWAFSGRTNDYLTFTTTLVGVTGDGHASYSLNDPRVTFTWKSNTIIRDSGIVGGGIYYRGAFYPDRGLWDPVVGGGVFDVRYGDGTPVPGTPPDAPALPTFPLNSPGGAALPPENSTPAPVAPLDIAVGGGTLKKPAAQRITITFSGPVNFAPGAFVLRNQKGRKASKVGLRVVKSSVDGKAAAVLRFTGGRRSLPAGKYTLTIRSRLVIDPLGRPLDGDADGSPGGDMVLQLRIARGRRA